MNAQPETNDTHRFDEPLWAHRDQGFVTYAIALGIVPVLISDVCTPRPLFVFHEGAAHMDNVCAGYKMHQLDSYKHMEPASADARTMACADMVLDTLLADGRAFGMGEIALTADLAWTWPATDEEKEAVGDQLAFL